MAIFSKAAKKIIRISLPALLRKKRLRALLPPSLSTAIEYQLRHMYSNDHRTTPSRSENTVLMAPIIGLWEAPLAFQAALTIELQKLGTATKFLACDRYLPICMADSEEYILGLARPLDKIKRSVKCAECTASIKSLGSVLNTEVDSLRQFNQTKKNTNSIAKVNDEHAASSTVRKTLSAEVGDIEGSAEIFDRFKRTSQNYFDLLIAYLTERRPKAVVMIHGIYLEHGPLVQACQHLDIPVYVYGFSYRNNTISITSGDTYHRKIYQIDNDTWANVTLTNDQKEKLDDYLGSKISGGRDFVNYHPNPIVDENNILKRLNIDTDEPVILFCTNVLWDATIYYKSHLYTTILEAVFDTIEMCIRKQRQLIIRIHPAESKGGFTTRRPFKREIEKKYPTLPNNIKIVDASSDISTYVLADLSDLIINYASNVGLEFAVAGKRVVNLGNAFAANRGFTIEPTSLAEYSEILQNPFDYSKVSQPEIELATKFAYFWNFQFMTDLPQLQYDILKTRETTIRVSDFKITPAPTSLRSNLAMIAGMINSTSDIDYNNFNS